MKASAVIKRPSEVMGVAGKPLSVYASVSMHNLPSVIPYTGDYEFTPTDATQTIPISGKTASMDIIINPIPSNYGLITWDGSTLTVS